MKLPWQRRTAGTTPALLLEPSKCPPTGEVRALVDREGRPLSAGEVAQIQAEAEREFALRKSIAPEQPLGYRRIR